MAGRGGKRQGAGRKPLDASDKKSPKTIWLLPAEQAFCLQFGDTVQDGIRRLIQQAMKGQGACLGQTFPLDGLKELQ
jgi:hypothetical protein